MSEIKLIGEIDFLDTKVNVYHDPYSENKNSYCLWRMRNPDSCYQGIMFLNQETGKISYPEDAIIPEQTEEDREILPQAIITGQKEIDDEFVGKTLEYLKSDYSRRNGK